MGSKVTMKILDRGLLASSFALILFASACSKKPPVAPAPPPAPGQAPAAAPGAPERPAITFTIEPSSVERGHKAVMRWAVTNATGVSIDNGIGTVPSTGTRNLTPTATATYRLSATGPGG